MISLLTVSNINIAKQVLTLQKLSYTVEAELTGYYAIPPLHEKLKDLLACDQIFYGNFTGDHLTGVISYKIEDKTIDIYRLAVHPGFFRRGIARSLLGFIETAEKGMHRILVSTGEKNKPAAGLYCSQGFIKTGNYEVDTGFFLAEFEKILQTGE